MIGHFFVKGSPRVPGEWYIPFATFGMAERYGRDLMVRRRTNRVTILHQASAIDGVPTKETLVARIFYDALGRLWTDILDQELA